MMQEKQGPLDLLVQEELERMAEEDDEHPEDDLPARLRRLMDELGITQRQLAETAGVSPHTIRALLKGRHSIRPAPETLRGIVFALSPHGGLGGTDGHVIRFSMPLVRMFLAYERATRRRKEW